MTAVGSRDHALQKLLKQKTAELEAAKKKVDTQQSASDDAAQVRLIKASRIVPWNVACEV